MAFFSVLGHRLLAHDRIEGGRAVLAGAYDERIVPWAAKITGLPAYFPGVEPKLVKQSALSLRLMAWQPIPQNFAQSHLFHVTCVAFHRKIPYFRTPNQPKGT
jgi:hypothetical protein